MSPRLINYIITTIILLASLHVAPSQSRQQPALLIMNYVKNFVKNHEQLHWLQAAGGVPTSPTTTTPTTTTTTSTTEVVSTTTPITTTTEVVSTPRPTTTTTKVVSTLRPTTTTTEVISKPGPTTTTTKVVSTPSPTTTTTEVISTPGPTITTTEVVSTSIPTMASTKVESTTILTTSTKIESTTMPTTTEPIIITGELAEKGEFPFMALIHFMQIVIHTQPNPDGPPIDENLYRHGRTCGGTLLNARYVLTTANCAIYEYVKVDRDELGVSRHIIVKLNGMEIAGDKMIPHPKYKRSIKYKDIGLVRMERSVKFTSGVLPACIRGRKPSDITAIAAGWGRFNKLLKSTYELYPNLRCAEIWDVGPEWPHGIDDSMGCAGVRVGHRNTQLCGHNENDATLGGPVFVRNPQNKYCKFSVIGIITSGAMQCGPMEYAPDNYTSLSEFIDWIEEVIYP